MFEELRSAVATIESFVADLEPGVLDARGAVRLVKEFALVEHLGAAGKALAAKRVDETGAYRESGARSAGHWLALRTGVPVASAFRALETVEALGDLPVTNGVSRREALGGTGARDHRRGAQGPERGGRAGRGGAHDHGEGLEGSLPSRLGGGRGR